MAYKRYLRSKYGRSYGYTYGKGKKWSTESCCRTLSFDTTSTTQNALIVDSTDVQGQRKAAYFTLNIASPNSTDSSLPAIYWALVYVPEGASPNQLHLTDSTDLYQPSNYILGSGVWQPGSQNRFKIAGLRKLNAGDKIYLVGGQLGTAVATNVQIVCQYKISF